MQKTPQGRHFNSHPHEEDDYATISSLIIKSYFNSHPHEEDDWIIGVSVAAGETISTHILTRRMTKIHETCNTLPDNFNSHPHEEDDGKNTKQYIQRCISTHILTRRMTIR